MISGILGRFAGFPLTKVLVGFSAALIIAVAILWSYAQSASERASRYKVERDVLRSSLDNEIIKRKSLAERVLDTGQRLQAEERTSFMLQQELHLKLDENEALAAAAKAAADAQRKLEEGDGNATFDSRGIY